MKNLSNIQNIAKDQIINNADLQSLKGGLGDPPPFGVFERKLTGDPPPYID